MFRVSCIQLKSNSNILSNLEKTEKEIPKSPSIGFTLNPFEIFQLNPTNKNKNTNRRGSEMSSNALLEALIPLIPEYGNEMREFGELLLKKLTEKIIARGIRVAFIPGYDPSQPDILPKRRSLLRGGKASLNEKT